MIRSEMGPAFATDEDFAVHRLGGWTRRGRGSERLLCLFHHQIAQQAANAIAHLWLDPPEGLGDNGLR